jgi:MFS family permease
MSSELRPTNILQSFKIVKGNTRISVLFEPLWGIPYAMYSFYLSLYMKSRGITDEQIGYLIAIGFISSIVCSMLGGQLSDALGRKRTTLIFDLLAWPVAIIIYLFSGNFRAFVIAQVVNSMCKITAISWNLMVVEDADIEQQVAAYNLLNAINICAGIFTPLAGIIIKRFGMVSGEQVLLGLAAVSMTAMMLLRHHYYHETQVGREILAERRNQPRRNFWKGSFNFWQTLRTQPLVGPALLFGILFNAYIPIGTYSSLYYGPYLTEALKLDKAAIALLGGINAGVILLVFLFLVPLFSRLNRSRLMTTGIWVQIVALLLLILIPPGGFGIAVMVIVLFALGYGMAKPLVDSVLAGVTAGKERAGVYAFYNVGISIFSAGLGLGSGYLYRQNPAGIYWASIGILLLCIGCLVRLERLDRKQVGMRHEAKA